MTKLPPHVTDTLFWCAIAAAFLSEIGKALTGMPAALCSATVAGLLVAVGYLVKPDKSSSEPPKPPEEEKENP